MIRQIVEISKDGFYINQNRGFLVISEGGVELSQIPLSDISVLMLTATGITLSKNALMALNEKGTPILFCGKTYSPESILVPLFSNYEFSGRLQIQINCSEPLKKQLWKTVIQEKITNQAFVLSCIGKENEANFLKKMVSDVLSGDTTNREASAARYYWKQLFGDDFFRIYDEESGINSYLNYGYAVLRGTVARALCSAGLHLSLGIHHRSKINNMCLVDDMMEPFRPVVDLLVYTLLQERELTELNPKDKKYLVQVAHFDVIVNKGKSPLTKALEYYAYSLFESFKQKGNILCVPKLPQIEKVEDQTFPLPF